MKIGSVVVELLLLVAEKSSFNGRSQWGGWVAYMTHNHAIMWLSLQFRLLRISARLNFKMGQVWQAISHLLFIQSNSIISRKYQLCHIGLWWCKIYLKSLYLQLAKGRDSLYLQLAKGRDSLYLQLTKGRDCLYLQTLPKLNIDKFLC